MEEVKFYSHAVYHVEYIVRTRKWPKRFSFNILIGWKRNPLIRETNRGFLEL